MIDLRGRRWLGLVVAGLILAPAAGCGEGERMETGTSVQVTRDMEAEAKASDAFLTEQSKAKKKGGPAVDNKIVPNPNNVVPNPANQPAGK